MALVMGVDSSTQSCKVQVRDAADGTLVAECRAPHPPTAPPRSEQDPEAWWRALVDATGQLGDARRDVAAISVAGQQHGMVVCDAEGHPLRPAKLWNDTESAPQAAALTAKLGAAAWAEAIGSVPVASFTVTKLAWLAEHEAELIEQIATVLLPHDWLTFRLTGKRVTDRGDASGTGYWSPSAGAWRLDLLAEATGLGAAVLPTVLGPTDAAGPLTDDAADALGLPAGLPVAAGTGDNMAGALGLGLCAGDVVISLGTSGTVFAVSNEPIADPTGAVAGFADATGRFLPLVCTLNATQVTDTVARLLGADLASLDALALAAPPGSGGLVLLPYLNGERTPNRPDATGVLSGIRIDATREGVARAAFEGVVCGLLDGLDALAAAGVATPGRVLLIGGGAHSAAYRHVVADLAQRPVTIPAGDEHVATGACVQAAAMLAGTDPPLVGGAWGLGVGEEVEPDATVDATSIRDAYVIARG